MISKYSDILSICKEFFEKKYSAELKKAYVNEFNFGGFIVPVIYIFVEFKNINVFGNGYFNKGVFERYRKMTHEMMDYFSEIGQADLLIGKEIPLIPLLCEEPVWGKEVVLPEIDKDLCSPLEIIELDKYGKKDEMIICRDWPEVNWGLRRLSDGRIYHIGESNYVSYLSACECRNSINTIVDFGVGSGNTARLAVSRINLKRMILNDYDEGVCKQLESAISDDYKRKGIELEIVTGDCMDAEMPKDGSVDIFDISTNKDVLATFIHVRKKDILQALKPDGLMIAQIGGLSTVFEQMLITQKYSSLFSWPWMNNLTSLENVFEYCHFLEINGEVVAICSNDKVAVDKTLNKIKEYTDFRKYDFFEGGQLVEF